MSYETTLQRVRDLSEGRVKAARRVPIIAYVPPIIVPPDQPVIEEELPNPPIQRASSVQAVPVPERKLGYRDYDYPKNEWFLEDLQTHEIVFRHADKTVVRDFARANNYQLL